MGVVVSVYYLGKGLRREEAMGYEVASDWHADHRKRTSEDNGGTWSDWTPVPSTWPVKDGFSREQPPCARCYDLASGGVNPGSCD